MLSTTIHGMTKPPVVIGCDGDTPSVSVVSPATTAVVETLELGPGERPTSLGLIWQPDEGDDAAERPFVLVGTRAGTLVKRPLMSEAPQTIRLDIAAPVLAVLVLDHRHVVTSDENRRVLMWDMADPGAVPRCLPNHASPIVSLGQTPDGRIMGLTRKGWIVRWKLEENSSHRSTATNQTGKIVQALVGGVSPSEPTTPGNLVLWPDGDRFVLGDKEGWICSTRLGTGTFDVWPGHTGGSCVIGTYGHLLTLGLKDNTLRAWDTGGRETDRWPLPSSRMFNGCVVSDEPLVLLTGVRETVLYDLTGGRLTRRGTVPLAGGGIAAPVAADRWKHWQQQVCESRARAIVSQLKRPSDQRDPDSTDQLHEELSALGYRHVSLSLYAADLESQGYREIALRHYQQLAENLSDGPHAMRALERYAELLRIFGWPQAAADVRARLAVCGGEQSAPLELADIRDHPADRIVLDPGQRWDLWVESAQQLNWPTHGRCVVRKAEPSPCRDGVTTEQIGKQYEVLRKQHSGFPEGHIEKLIDKVETSPSVRPSLVIPVACVDGIGQVEVRYHLEPYSAGMLQLKRAMLLRIEKPSGDAMDHNERVRQWLTTQHQVEVWPQVIDDMVHDATAAALTQNTQDPGDWGMTR